MQEEIRIQVKSGEKEEMRKSKFWNIDRQMLPYKIHFFLWKGAMAAFLPYLPSIGITRLKLGAANLAVIFTVQQFLVILFKPVMGYISDYFNNLKTMIVTLVLVSVGLSYLLLVIPARDVVSTYKWVESGKRHQENFCDICHISDINLQNMDELFPQNILINETSCENQDITEKFVIHCSQNNLSSISYKILYKTCSLLRNETEEISKNNILTYSSKSNVLSKNKSTEVIGNTLLANIPKSPINIMHIAISHNDGAPLISIICPSDENYAENGKNISFHYIVNSCYKPHDNVHAIVTNSNISASEGIICKQELDESMETNSFKTYQYWLYAVILILFYECIAAVFTLADTACYESIQVTGAEFGKQRAWGSMGWALIAPFAGFLSDYMDSYLPGAILMSVLCVMLIWNLYKIDLVKPQVSQNILKDIKAVLSSAEFLTFDLGVFFNGMGIGIVWYYLAWFINDIGGSRLLLGLANTVQCSLGETPFMFISGWLIKKFGHFNVVSMSLAAHAVRFLAYSSLKNPWMILPIEILDGVTFGLFYSTVTSYGKLNSKAGTEATTQALLSATFEGLGAGLGCVIAGICFDIYGGYTTFFYASLCFAAATVINTSSSVLLKLRKGSLELSKQRCSSDSIRY